MNSTKKFLSLVMAMIMLGSVFSVAVSAASKVKISSCSFSYSKTKDYTGKAIKPSVTVKYNGKKLKKGTDYTLSYSNNKEVGTAKITVKGKGSYTGSKTLSFKIKLAKPNNLKASSIKATSVKLKWSKVTGAKKYTVYKYNTSTKKYSKLITVKKNAATIKELSSAKKYKFAVKAYDKNGKASTYSAKVTVNTLPATPKLKLSVVSDSKIKLSWKKIARATGYKIYSYDELSGEYTKIKTIKDASTLEYTAKKLESGTSYSFSVEAYYKAGGKTIYSKKSAVKTATTTGEITPPGKVAGLKATDVGSKSLSLSWSAVKGASGYNVYSYNRSTKKYTKLGTVSATSYSVSGLKEKTTYNYAVEAYKTASGKTVAGAKSDILSVTTAESSQLNDFQSIIRSRKFTINYTITMDGTTVKTKTVVSGNVVSSTMETSLEGMDATMYLWYDGEKKSGIVRAKAMGVFKFYDTYGENEAKENGMDANMMVALFAPEKAEGTSVVTGKGKVGSKECETYSYVTAGGGTVTYYFYNSKLIRIVYGGETIEITSYSGTVNSKDIKKPSTTGWIKMDIF